MCQLILTDCLSLFNQVATRGLCAIAQAESLRYKLIGGLAVRRACYGVLRFIMESGAKVRGVARWLGSHFKLCDA